MTTSDDDWDAMTPEQQDQWFDDLFRDLPRKRLAPISADPELDDLVESLFSGPPSPTRYRYWEEAGPNGPEMRCAVVHLQSSLAPPSDGRRESKG